MSEYVEGVFGGQALKLTPLQRLKVEKENLQAIVLYVKKNESSEDFEYVYIHKTGAYIDGQDVVEVSLIGLPGEIPPEKEWVHDVATFEGDIVYINGGHIIDELLLLDYLPEIEEIESWHDVPLYDPEEIDYQYTLIEQTDERITALAQEVEQRIDGEVERLEGRIDITSEEISSVVQKSLLSSAIAVLRQDVSGNIDTLPVESLKEDLPKGTELVIMDIETFNIFTVITSADTNKGDTQIPIEEAPINIPAESTIHLELSSVASKIAQLADSYTLNIEGDGVVTGFKSALGEDGVSDFVIQADKFRIVGTKNGQPFGEGKSIFEVDTTTEGEKIYLNAEVILRGNIVQTPDGEEVPIPVFRGKYSETYTYHKYDQVSHDGAVWIFMSDTPKTGEEPVIGSPYWDIYVEKGESAPELKVEYSANQNGPWSSSYVEGHLWMRTSNDGGNTWSASVRIVGEDGVDGQDGKYTDYQFAKNTSLTTAPSSGWDEVPPSLGVNEYLWMRVRVVTPSGAGDWGTPVRISGPKGEKGDPAPTLKAQYSTAPSGATWYNTYAEGRKWMRTSADNGVTWSTPVKVVGEDGSDGVDGKYTEYQFAKNTSLTTAPTSGWTDAPPSLGTTEYLWMRTRVVTPSGAGDWTTPVRISGPKGEKGDPAPTLKAQYSTAPSGATWYNTYAEGRKWMRTSADNGVTWSTPVKVVGEDGSDGVDGKYTEYQFAKNTSLTTAPTSGWTDAPPSLGTTEYLWMRTRVVTPSGAGDWTTPVRISGPKGEKGDPAPTLKAQYSTAPSGATWYNTYAEGRKWMRTSADNGVTWSTPAKIVGEDGSDGVDGKYTEYQFAKNTSLTTAPTSGWTDAPPSLGTTEYLWMRTRVVTPSGAGSWSTAVRISGPKGEKGDNAPLIKLSGATQVIKVSATGVVTPSANFTVIGTPINTTITTFRYSTNGASFTATPPTGVTRSGNTVTINPNTSTFITLTIRASDGTVSDSFTIARVGDGVDGKDGADGTNGVNGVDGVWGILSNHAHTVPSSSTGVVSNYTGSGTTIQVFEGSTALTYHTTIANSRFRVGTPTVSPASAIKVGARSGSGTTTCTVANHSAMKNAQDMVQITYPITARRANGTSVTFNLVQTITKSKAGEKGEKGEKGDQGEQGPGLIFRGNWQANEVYYRNADRRDAVKYGNNYYLCNINNTTGVLPTNTSYWKKMNYYANIATGLMLAEDATINRYLTLSEGGVMRTEDGSVTFGSDGIRMKPSGYPQRSMHLDGAQLAFWDKNNLPSVALGDLTQARQNIIDAGMANLFPSGTFPEYGFLMMQGNIAAPDSVLRNSLINIPGDKLEDGSVVNKKIGDGAVTRRKLAAQSVGIAELDTDNLYIPEPGGAFLLRNTYNFAKVRVSSNWATLASFTQAKNTSTLRMETLRLYFGLTTEWSAGTSPPYTLEVLIDENIVYSEDKKIADETRNISITIDALHLPSSFNVTIRARLPGNVTDMQVFMVEVYQNNQLPIREGVPVYVSADGAVPSGCRTTCQAACQTSCESSCQSSCEGSCETDCQVTCETACQTSCQATCEKTSQSGGGCIRQGTPVDVWDLEAQEYITVPVEDLKPGMILPWYQPETDTVIHGELLELRDAGYSNNFLRIRTTNGPSVDVTYSQPFDVLADLGQGQKWYKLQAMYLRPGMQLVRPFEAPNNRLSTIVSVETVREPGVHFWNPKMSTGGYCVNGYADMLVK